MTLSENKLFDDGIRSHGKFASSSTAVCISDSGPKKIKMKFKYYMKQIHIYIQKKYYNLQPRLIHN